MEEFEIVDAKSSKRGETLIVKQGELVEVSVVTFPAQAEATMSVVKSRDAAGLDPVLLGGIHNQIARIKELLR